MGQSVAQGLARYREEAGEGRVEFEDNKHRRRDRYAAEPDRGIGKRVARRRQPKLPNTIASQNTNTT